MHLTASYLCIQMAKWLPLGTYTDCSCFFFHRKVWKPTWFRYNTRHFCCFLNSRFQIWCWSTYFYHTNFNIISLCYIPAITISLLSCSQSNAQITNLNVPFLLLLMNKCMRHGQEKWHALLNVVAVASAILGLLSNISYIMFKDTCGFFKAEFFNFFKNQQWQFFLQSYDQNLTNWAIWKKKFTMEKYTASSGCLHLLEVTTWC